MFSVDRDCIQAKSRVLCLSEWLRALHTSIATSGRKTL